MSDQDLVVRLVSALEALQTKEMHTKAPASAQTGTLLHQPGGMFTTVGLKRDVVSTHVSPRGLGAALPVLPADDDDPRYTFLTGFSDDIGSEPEGVCDDAPTGFMKGGSLTATFGLVKRQTDTIQINKLLHRKRGVTTDLRLMNSVFNGNVGLDMSSMTDAQLLNLAVKAEMVDVGVRMERKLSTLLWQGAITNNTGGGGYKEFPGLDSQIATGHVDAETNTAMPAADSLIHNFNYNAVDGTTLDIVEYLSMAEFYMRHIADRTNMNPVTWAIVMRPELWFELSAVWPCRYLTHRCADNSGNAPMVINDNVNVAMRDSMRNGFYIDINGNRYPVIIDDGIMEHTNITNANVPAGHYASSAYFVPLRIRGAFPTIYWEHVDYAQVNSELSPLGQGRGSVPFWSDSGRYLWVYRDNGYCFDLQAMIEPRAVLRTPHLAYKLQNILYSPLEHLRSPYPTSPYWQDGGTSLPATSTSYAVWGNTTT